MISPFLNNDNSKLRKLTNFDYIFFFVVVIYAAMAVPATNSMIRPEGGGILAYIIPWGLCAAFIIKHRINFNHKRLIITISIYIIWVILQTLKYGIFYTGSFIFLGNIIIAFSLIRVYDFRRFFLYEKILVIMACVSITFWLMQVLLPSAFSTFMLATTVYDFPPGGTIMASNLLFSLSDYTLGVKEGHLIPRNSGFSWEPGRYSSMIIFAMFFNIIRNKFKVKSYSFAILLLALLTTQSTTGFSAFLLVLLMIVLNKGLQIRMLSTLFILIPISVGAFYLPFMGDKIKNFWYNEDNIEIQIEIAEYHTSENDYDYRIIPQRFDSLAYHLMNINDSPVLGYGVAPANSYVLREISPIISPTGGIIRLFSQFGCLIGLLGFYYLYKTSEYFSFNFEYKGKFWLFIIFSLLSISYSFWNVPIFMSLWMFTLFNNKQSYKLT